MLDRNVFEIPPEAIASTRVVMTVVGGTTVFERHGRDTGSAKRWP